MDNEEYPTLDENNGWTPVVEVLADPKTGHLAVKCSTRYSTVDKNVLYTGYLLATVIKGFVAALKERFDKKNLNSEQLEMQIKNALEKELVRISQSPEPKVIDKRKIDEL